MYMHLREWLMGIVVVAALMAGVAHAALPSESAIAATEPLIKELTEGDYAAVKDGKKTRMALAEVLLKYVDDAETDAAKYILIRDAFKQYMAGGEFAKAMDTYHQTDIFKDACTGVLEKWSAEFVPRLIKKNRADALALLLNTAVERGDLDSAIAMARPIKSAIMRLKKSKAGAELQTALTRVTELQDVQRQIRKLRAAVIANEEDKSAQDSLGRYLAAAGDWKGALKAFEKSSGEIVEVAQFEQDYPETGSSELTTAQVAHFWWKQADETKEGAMIERALRAHAAGWYKIALDNGTLSGLKRTLAEKRIAEAEAQGDVSNVGPQDSAAPANAKKIMTLRMGGGVEMVLQPCPAGTFEMGYKYGPACHQPHKVKISRPFWMAKYLTTREQWGTIETIPRMNAVDEALGGLKAPVSKISPVDVTRFCAALTKKYARILPKGYVFRLPTDAEWEYACRANAKPNDPYGMPRGLSPENGGPEIAVRIFMKAEMLKKKKVNFDENAKWALPGVIGGSRKPNAWGLYDMIGNLEEITLDCVPRKLPDGYEQKGGATPEGISYVDGTDPLSWVDSGERVNVVRGNLMRGEGWGGPKRCLFENQRVPCVGFRIVAGPDLVKEQKSKRAKR